MFTVQCPHCKEDVLIEEINCAIFRHAILKHNYEQINPHTSKEQCENLIKNESIYGCGKPFKIVQNENKEHVAVECDYI